MFNYSMNETLCSAVEQTSDSRNIETVINSNRLKIPTYANALGTANM